jgi:CBS domain containing-hemolysin-like protein
MLRLALLVLANVAGSAFCSLSEAALLASSEARIRARQQLGLRGAGRLLAVRRDPARTLASIVFLNNVFAIAGTAFITSEGTKVIDSPEGMGLLIAIQTVLIIAFGEILPKVFGEATPEPIAAFVAPALVWIRRILFPMVWLMQHLVGWARPRVRTSGGQESEIMELATIGHERGHLDSAEADLIHRVFRLDDIEAADVMTPRALVKGFPADATLASERDALLVANHNRFPVYERDLDTVVGVLWLRDAMTALVQGRGETTFRELMRKALFIPQTRTVDDVLRDLQTAHRRMAIVVDEYGVTMGIITMDDLVEELIGEAIDETDVSEGLVKRLSKSAALMHGLTRVCDAARYLRATAEYEDPDDETNTLTGLLQDRLGRIPEPGDAVALGSLRVEARESDGRSATRVLCRNTARP